MGRLSLVFVVVAVAAMLVAACGRQVTPNPPGLGAGGAPPGYMAVRFDVNSTLNFSNNEYMFVFNTAGTGQTPSTDTVQTNWAGYSFALVALGRAGVAGAEPVQFVPQRNPKAPPVWHPLGSTPQQFSFNPNSNGLGTEFSMLFQQSVLAGMVTPSPSPSPSSTPRPPYAQSWLFNAFVTQPGASGGEWLFLDSMGAGGPGDPQYVSPSLCITEPFDNTYYAQGTQHQQLVSVEIANNPVSPRPCP